MNYEFITNGCGNRDDINGGQLKIFENGKSGESKFSIQSFQFEPISKNIYFHCHVKICDSTIETCEPVCAGRHARGVDYLNEELHMLSVGPLTVY